MKMNQWQQAANECSAHSDWWEDRWASMPAESRGETNEAKAQLVKNQGALASDFKGISTVASDVVIRLASNQHHHTSRLLLLLLPMLLTLCRHQERQEARGSMVTLWACG